jgi:hypothetical protein
LNVRRTPCGIAARDQFALELVLAALVPEAKPRPLGFDRLHAYVLDLEQERQPGLDARRDQILDHFRLTVDDDRAASGQVAERDAVALAVELNVDAAVNDALRVHPCADPGLSKQLHRALLEHAGTDAVLDVLAAAVLEDDALDSLHLEQPRERQPRGPGADDADLCPHARRLVSQCGSGGAARAEGLRPCRERRRLVRPQRA